MRWWSALSYRLKVVKVFVHFTGNKCQYNQRRGKKIPNCANTEEIQSRNTSKSSCLYNTGSILFSCHWCLYSSKNSGKALLVLTDGWPGRSPSPRFCNQAACSFPSILPNGSRLSLEAGRFDSAPCELDWSFLV